MIEHESSTFAIGTQQYTVERYAKKNGSGKRPVVVVVHGVDGMSGESGTEIRKLAEHIAGQGFLVLIPHYFDASDGADTLPLEQLFDRRVPSVANYPARIAAAVDYAVSLAGADSNLLGMVGISLGGGLALEYAESVRGGKVKALVDYFGFIPDPKIWANARRLPPTLILHNNADDIVKVESSSQPLLEALDKTRVIHDHRFYDDANPARRHHPFLPGGKADVDSRARSVAWLKTHLAAST
jgi:dienelactone hydrolase